MKRGFFPFSFLNYNVMSWLNFLNFLPSLINMGYDQYNQKQQFERQKELLDLQNNFTLDMWEKNNEFNDPSAQMQRLRNAGLSGIAAAQALSGSGAALSSTVQSSSSPAVGGSSLSHPSESVTDFMTQKAQREEMASQIAVNKAMESKINSEESQIVLNAQKAREQMDAQIERWRNQNQLDSANARHMNTVVDYMIEDRSVDRETKLYLLQQSIAQWDLIQTQVRKLESDIALQSSEAAWYDEQTATQKAITQFKEWYAQFCVTNNFIPDKGLENALISLFASGNQDYITKLMNLSEDVQYHSQYGSNKANLKNGSNGELSFTFKPFRRTEFSVSVPARWADVVFQLIGRYIKKGGAAVANARTLHDCKTLLRAQIDGLKESLDTDLDDDTWYNLERLVRQYEYLIDNLTEEQAAEILNNDGVVPETMLNDIDYTKIGQGNMRE